MSNETIKTLITVPLSEPLLEKLNHVSPRFHFHIQPVLKASEITADIWAETEILYTNHILPEPGQAPGLNWIQLHSSNVDKILTNPLLQNKNIKLTTPSGANAAQAAEFALMAMLALGHKLPDILHNQQNTKWDESQRSSLKPHELRGSTVGILGYGSIGRELARLLQPFQVKVLAIKQDVMHPQDTGYMPENNGDPQGDLFHRLYPVQALNSMLKECDFIVLCLPLTKETRDLIGEKEFESMKPGAYLVNIANGEIIHANILINALRKKQIAGAALDVFPEEPLAENSSFWKLPNTIISPHIASNSIWYNERAIELFIENLNRYLSGGQLLNQVDFEKGY